MTDKDKEKTDPGGDGEGFIQRWARLKEESRTPEARTEDMHRDGGKEGRSGAPPTVQGGSAGTPVPASAPAPAPVSAPVGDPAELPSLGSLTDQSDYSPFLRPGVPDALRRQALRRLWACDPAALLPELLDAHNIDYNAVPIFPDGLKSAYQAGTGFIDPEQKAGDAEQAGDQVRPGDPAQPEDKPPPTTPTLAAPAPPPADSHSEASPATPPSAVPHGKPDKSA
mgnify:CR=1 FL=1